MAYLQRFVLAANKSVTRVSRRNFGGGWICASRDYDGFKRSLTEPLRHAESSGRTFQNIFLFASVPCLLLGMYGAYVDHAARKKRERPKYIALTISEMSPDSVSAR
ncbi:cytochrome c oxidase subunit VIa [Cooperia oncophora]